MIELPKTKGYKFKHKGKNGLECHHMIPGSTKKIFCDYFDLVVLITPKRHRGTYGVHGKNGGALNLFYKEEAQKQFEEKYTREDFIKVFGRSYL